MEKKKTTIFILIIVFLGVFNLVKDGKCITYTYVWYFNTDKNTYYNDEEIYINASWDLDYGGGEISFVQIRIFNESWGLLWNSTEYNQRGTHIEGEWYVKIINLGLPFNNTSNDLIVAFYYYLKAGTPIEDLKEIRHIRAIKRNISCELIDFKQNINYGDRLQVKARFYSSENNSELVNHLVAVTILSNKGIQFENNFTTNSSGIIEFSIPTFENFTIGSYTVRFEVKENIFYIDTTFEYQFYVGKILSKETSVESANSKDDGILNSNILPVIISILSISILALLIVYHSNIKKAKQKDLSDLTFKF